MRAKKQSADRSYLAELEPIPNIGPAVAADLRQLGVVGLQDLVGRDPYALHEELCKVTGKRHDPCLLDTFIAAVRFMGGEPARPWWACTAERKTELKDRRKKLRMPMPRQNRVMPSGEMVATAERGTFLGNRGVLHDTQGCIRRSWQLKRWLLCLRAFRGRRRQIMRPGHYTELFFLDEAIGLAAGHRPCAECRRDRYRAFCNAWPAGRMPATVLDNQLHDERLNPDGSQRRFEANLDDLPDGIFIMLRGRACLLWRGRLHTWSPGGYRDQVPRPKGETVAVLTPRSTVKAIGAGYVPEVHPSARIA